MGTVRAIYVGQSEGGTLFAGNFSSELQDVHAGTEVDVIVTPVETTEATEPADTETPAEDAAEPAEGAGETQ